MSPGLELQPLTASSAVIARADHLDGGVAVVASPPWLDPDRCVVDQILDACRSAGLDAPPPIVDFLVDELGAEALLARVPRPMSRGEWQVCGLLCALARPFDTVVAIDPTAGLDARRRRVVADLLHDLATDHQVVCASDDPFLTG